MVCGDIGIYPKIKNLENFVDQLDKKAEAKSIDIHFIKGNHEDHDYLNEISAGSLDIVDLTEYVHYHPNCCVWEWNDVVFGAMGGAYSINKEFIINSGLWFENEMITNEDVEKSKNMGKVDVLICHDQPFTGNIDDYMDDPMHVLTNENRRLLQRVCENVRPGILYHGHYHHRMDFKGNYTVNEKLVEFPIIALHCERYFRKQYIIFDTNKMINGKYYG
jgi:hypothetical protein